MEVALWPNRYPKVIKEGCNEDCEHCDEFKRKGLGCLRQKRNEIGPIAYDKEYQCTPRSNISSLFPSDLMKKNFNPGAVMVHTYDGTYEVVTGWDIARSATVGADWLVAFTIGYERSTRKRFILNITREKGVGFSRQVDMIAEHYARYNDTYIIIEADMNQDLWVEIGRKRYPDIPVYSHYTRGAKADLKNGIPSLIVPLENRLYSIPRGDAHSKLMTDMWLGESLAFGWENDKLEGVGEHDDIIIAWWKAEIGVKKLEGGRVTSGKLNMRGGVEI